MLGDSIPPIILLSTVFGWVVCRCFVLNIGMEFDVILEFGFDNKEFSLESVLGYKAFAIPHASTTENFELKSYFDV